MSLLDITAYRTMRAVQRMEPARPATSAWSRWQAAVARLSDRLGL